MQKLPRRPRRCPRACTRSTWALFPTATGTHPWCGIVLKCTTCLTVMPPPPPPGLSPPPPPTPAVSPISIPVGAFDQTSGGAVSTSFGTCPGGGQGTGYARDKALARYVVTLPVKGSYVMEVQFGHSGHMDKTYARWDAEPTTANYDLFAGETATNKLLTSEATTLDAGTHAFWIGSSPDGNWYTLPWCALTVKCLNCMVAPPPPPS